jgi:hypothetical protein
LWACREPSVEGRELAVKKKMASVAKEVGMGDPAEETIGRQLIHYLVATKGRRVVVRKLRGL